MKKQIKLNIEVGDPNYVKCGEYFAEIYPNGKLKSIKQKKDDQTFDSIMEHVELEDDRDVIVNETPLVIIPNPGKDAIKKVTVTVPIEEGTATKSISSLKAGTTLVIEPSEGKIGLSKVTITFIK